MTKINKFSLHKFDSRENINFDINLYSKLKYGSNVGYKFGVELANNFFNKHKHLLSTKQIVITESAYQMVRNAASVITDGFYDQLNQLLCEYNGFNCYRVKINRIVPYIQDYGKVSIEERVNLLKEDTFTMDFKFVRDKFIIFLDDIFITGTHQRKIEEMCENNYIDLNNCMCVYYAELTDPLTDPSIESYLNSYKIKTLNDLLDIINSETYTYNIVVRTLKMILQSDKNDLIKFLPNLSKELIVKIYKQILAEGYHKNIDFTENFNEIKKEIN